MDHGRANEIVSAFYCSGKLTTIHILLCTINNEASYKKSRWFTPAAGFLGLNH